MVYYMYIRDAMNDVYRIYNFFKEDCTVYMLQERLFLKKCLCFALCIHNISRNIQN